MSKKDRQHQQPLTPQLMNQPDAPNEPDSREAEIRSLRAHLERVTEDYEILLTHHKNDLGLLSKAARHGAPPEGFEPKTAEGKEALEQVVLLGNIATTQRARADSEAKGRNELASDLMVLEQTAAGRVPDIALQTDLGKSAARALGDVLTSLDMLNEQRLDGDALPANGWSSDTARQLVESVGPQPGLRASDARSLLLGDLLAQLLPHTGETGQNETASDTLKRALVERRQLTDLTAEVQRVHDELEARLNAQSERMMKIQSAMVARRAPDAAVGVLLEDFVKIMGPVADAMGHERKHLQSAGLPILLSLVKEWQGLRAVLSPAPLTAVAVRDDGATGPVRERFSLLVLTWDGKAVSMRYVEENRPWGDISPYLEQTVRKHLIPGAYR